MNLIQTTGITKNTAQQVSSWIKRIAVYAVLIVILIMIFGYGFLQARNFYARISANWNEIKFAYDHPNIVKPLEHDYTSRSTQLEKSYEQVSATPTPDQQLVQQVVSQLKQSK